MEEHSLEETAYTKTVKLKGAELENKTKPQQKQTSGVVEFSRE